MSDEGYPVVRLHRTEYGYVSRDGKYAIVRDDYIDVGSSNAGCYRRCWHVHRQSPSGERIAKFLPTLSEARLEIACDIDSCAQQHLCRHGIDA